jgi:hypothetical protein
MEKDAERVTSNETEYTSALLEFDKMISGIKRMFTLKYKLRVKKYYQHDQLMLLGCGLHNFRVKNRNQTIIN